MSAAEVIEMIKKLPPEERAEVVAFLKKDDAAVNESPAKYAPDEEFDRAVKRVAAENSDLLRRLAQ